MITLFWIWGILGVGAVVLMQQSIEYCAIVRRATARRVPEWTAGGYVLYGLLAVVTGPLGLAAWGYCWWYYRRECQRECQRPVGETGASADTCMTASGHDSDALEEQGGGQKVTQDDDNPW